jgi:hypothetical protein
VKIWSPRVPTPPRNARVVSDGGYELPLELVYVGVNAQGMHEWRPVHVPTLLPAGRWRLCVDELPARTAIVFGEEP